MLYVIFLSILGLCNKRPLNFEMAIVYACWCVWHNYVVYYVLCVCVRVCNIVCLCVPVKIVILSVFVHSV